MDDTISRQALLESIERISVKGNVLDDDWVYRFIQEFPSAQPEYRFDEWCTECKEYDKERHCCPRFNHVIRTTLQEVQERKKGQWIEYDNSHCECSVCHEEWSYFDDEPDRFNFCPNCGADMRKEE